jgi:hypothetical protein
VHRPGMPERAQEADRLRIDGPGPCPDRGDGLSERAHVSWVLNDRLHDAIPGDVDHRRQVAPLNLAKLSVPVAHDDFGNVLWDGGPGRAVNSRLAPVVADLPAEYSRYASQRREEFGVRVVAV